MKVVLQPMKAQLKSTVRRSQNRVPKHIRKPIYNRHCPLASFQLYLHSCWRQHGWEGFSTSPLRNPHWEQVQESAFMLENSVKSHRRTQKGENWATDVGDIGNERRKNCCIFSKVWNLNVKENIGWLGTYDTIKHIETFWKLWYSQCCILSNIWK